MRSAGVLALLLAVLSASACGADRSERARPTQGFEPAPPVEAIDEPAADRFFFPPEFVEGEPVEREVCRFVAEKSGESAEGQDDCDPSPEQIDAFLRFSWEDRKELAPAHASELRSIARLALKQRGMNDRATLTAWRSRAGKLCLATDIEDSEEVNGGNAYGPCLKGSRCAALCLERSGHYDYGTPPWLLSGVVAADAEQLRIVFADRSALRYPLRGPVVPGFPNQRVFMLDLGRRSHQKLELLIAGKVVAEHDEWPNQVATDRCELTYNRPEEEREFNECMDNVYAADE